MHGSGTRHGIWRVVAALAAGALAGLPGCKDDPAGKQQRPPALQSLHPTVSDEHVPDPAGDDQLVVRDGVTLHAPTGLIAAPGYRAVVSTCTACHSARLVVQNRLTRSRWAELLRWMQDEHNLWALPAKTRDTILDYLAAHYGLPEAERLRRRPLPSHLMPPTRAEVAQSSANTTQTRR